VHVATRTQGDCIVVSITDNGQGFEVSKALMSGGKGMSGQRSRTNGIGGDISWHSSQIGTCVSLSLPIKQPKIV
jgi:signal transduction histidine kinase